MKIECNITIDDDLFIQIVSVDGVTKTQPNKAIESANHLAGVNAIAQTVTCLTGSRSLDAYFNPTISDSERTRLMRCEWMRSGKLVVREETTLRKYQHADTVTDAMNRKRVFTCFAPLYTNLPKLRRKG